MLSLKINRGNDLSSSPFAKPGFVYRVNKNQNGNLYRNFRKIRERKQ
jgi:hypothetical protein